MSPHVQAKGKQIQFLKIFFQTEAPSFSSSSFGLTFFSLFF